MIFVDVEECLDVVVAGRDLGEGGARVAGSGAIDDAAARRFDVSAEDLLRGESLAYGEARLRGGQ